jgi:hypothetical protein
MYSQTFYPKNPFLRGGCLLNSKYVLFSTLRYILLISSTRSYTNGHRHIHTSQSSVLHLSFSSCIRTIAVSIAIFFGIGCVLICQGQTIFDMLLILKNGTEALIIEQNILTAYSEQTREYWWPDTTFLTDVCR